MSEIRASALAMYVAMYSEDENGDPLLVVRDEYDVLRPVGNPTRLKNVAVISGKLRRIEKDVLVMEPERG